jgi:hypothetical protein
MLHIVNGDATVEKLGPAALPGEVLVWRDLLVEGPVDAALDVEAFAHRRAPWLARRLGIAADRYTEHARALAEGLAQAVAHDEIVLWFEQDLFCVANLGYLAAWLRRTAAGRRVSLVFPPDPLGTTDPAALAALFTARRPFTDGAMAHAAGWWEAYASPDPRALEAMAGGPLPFLDVAARLHRARFPSLRSGLGSVEAAALDALEAAPRTVAEVFRAAARDERMRGHGMGDVQFAGHLHALADGPAPLVTIDGAPGDADVHAQRVASTAAGRAVRDGGRDRLDAQPLDWWLGGVHLHGREVVWRWDPQAARLVDTRERRRNG